MSRASGRAAKAAGDAWEAFVEAQHEAAKYLGVIVYVQHNEPGTKFVGGRLLHTKKSGTDFFGIMADGRAFATECKSTIGRLMRSDVQPKQVEQLDAVVKVGGEAWLLVEFRIGVEGYIRCAIPWKVAPWTKLRSADSISPDEMDPEWYIRPGVCYLKRGVAVPVGVGGRKRIFARE